MTAVSKPLYWSVGVPFNELFWASSTGALTENVANLLYLQKTVADTASSLETFSGGLLTNSVEALAITSNLGIATSQTSGVLNIGTLTTREAAGVINIGASGGLHTIVMDTSSVANTNAAPAISIGTSASAKTIKINNNTNSVHCSSIDLKGASINHIVANSATPITVGDGQTNSVGGLLIGCSAAGNVRTSAPIKIGADSTTTGVITIGASGSSTSLLGTTTVSALKTTSIDSTGAIVIGAAATGVTLGQASGATSILGAASTLTYTGGSTITCPTLSATSLDGATLSIGVATATAMTLARSACAVACNGMLTAAQGLTLPLPITLSYVTFPTYSAGQIGHRVQVHPANFTMTGTGSQNFYTFATLPIGVYILQAQAYITTLNYSINVSYSATSATPDNKQIITVQGILDGHFNFSNVWTQGTASNIYVVIGGSVVASFQLIYMTYTRIA